MTRKPVVWSLAFVCALAAHGLGLAGMNLPSETPPPVLLETEHDILLAPLGSLDGILEEAGEPEAPEMVSQPPPPPPRATPVAPSRDPLPDVVTTPIPPPMESTFTSTDVSAEPATNAPTRPATSTSNTASAPLEPAPGQARSPATPFGLPNGVEESQAQYASLLQAWFLKHKRYPHPARSRRQQGSVRVWFRVDSQGNILERRIDTGSGFSILDKATLDRASPVPTPPEILQATDLTFTVPIAYSLN
jgi:periplasmic protein TonB